MKKVVFFFFVTYFRLVCLLLPRLLDDVAAFVVDVVVLDDLPVLRPAFLLTGSGVALLLALDDFLDGLPKELDN